MAARALPLILLLALAACAPFGPAALAPTAASTQAPTAEATSAPTAAPTEAPTEAPTAVPTEAPTPSPAPAAQRAFFVGRDRQVRAATQRNRDIADLGALPPGSNALWLAPNGAALAFLDGDGRLTAQILATGERFSLSPPDLPLDPDGRGVYISEPRPAEIGVSQASSRWTLLGGVSFSPDGDALVYAIDSSDDPVNAPAPLLYLATLDGAPQRVIGPGFAPSWSPAGDRIAYLGPPFVGSPPFGGGSGGHPMLANADGSDPRTVGAEQEVYGSWAPLTWSDDGARLGAGTQLIDAASGAVVARAPDNDRVMIDGIQRVAPDGSSFLYWRNLRVGDSSAAGFHELDELLLVFEGGAARPLLRRPPNECPCLPVGGELGGAWAPSGDLIALADAELGLRLFTGDGTPIGRLPLPRGAELTGGAFWSEDENRLLLSLVVDRRTEAWLIDTRGELPRMLGEGSALGWGSKD
jgi:hypothetical protein